MYVHLPLKTSMILLCFQISEIIMDSTMVLGLE